MKTIHLSFIYFNWSFIKHPAPPPPAPRPPLTSAGGDDGLVFANSINKEWGHDQANYSHTVKHR